MLKILIIIAPLFIIIFSSALLQRFKKTGDNWTQVLNSFALNIGLPALIFSALSRTKFSFTEQFDLILANSIFIISVFILTLLLGKLLRLKKVTLRTIFICAGISNVAYLGLPILTQIKGEEILPTASLIVAVYLFWIFTIGLSFLDYSQQKKKKEILKDVLFNIIKNPLLIAVFIGIIVASFNFTVPLVITQAINMVSASVTPVVLVVIGLFIGNSRIGKIKEWIPVLIFSVFTLVISPALFYFGVTIFGFQTSQFAPSIIAAAMPLAITPFALADHYELNKEFIARSVVLSTILSVITIPFWTSLL